MIAIYKTPTNREFFDKHYFETHIRYEVAKGGIMSTTGHNDVYCIGTLYFESIAAIKIAFASEEGKACAVDRRILAPHDHDVQIFIFDSIEV